MVLTIIKRKPKVRRIPAYLVYEEMNGEALPYKGYLDVLATTKKPEEIMGSSSLQAVFVSMIHAFIYFNLNRKKYLVATNESGLHIGLNDNFANDIAIFEKEKITLNDKYFDVCPKVVIEVDIKVDLGETSWNSDLSYVVDKSQKMMDFGVGKLLWISTKHKKIFVIVPNENWYFVNFDQDILLLDGCTLNLAQLLADEEIEY